MLRNTLRMINQQDQWFNQLRREESARRTLRYSLYQALEQVERLLESDMMEVPIEMQARLRQIVEAVDPQLAYRMDQSGPSALDIQDIIFEAQDRLIKQVRARQRLNRERLASCSGVREQSPVSLRLGVCG